MHAAHLALFTNSFSNYMVPYDEFVLPINDFKLALYFLFKNIKSLKKQIL